MHVSEMINCCGIRVIYDLPGNGETPGYRISGENRQITLKFLKQYSKEGQSFGMTVVAINSLQFASGVGEVLEEAGMTKTLGPCFHPNHGHYIYLYSYIHHPKKNEAEVLRLSREVKEVIPTPSILNAVKKAG